MFVTKNDDLAGLQESIIFRLPPKKLENKFIKQTLELFSTLFYVDSLNFHSFNATNHEKTYFDATGFQG